MVADRHRPQPPQTRRSAPATATKDDSSSIGCRKCWKLPLSRSANQLSCPTAIAVPQRPGKICRGPRPSQTLCSPLPGRAPRRYVPGLRPAARPFVQKRSEGCSGRPSRASCTEGGPWGSIAKRSSLLTYRRPSMRWRLPRRARRRGAVSRRGGELAGGGRAADPKLAGRYGKLHFCYEAGPTGYGLYRQIEALGHACLVVAPALIPKRPGERVKTNRRDAVTLARLHRAGELTGVWVPDATHEAVRDLVRAREAAADDLRRKRQQLLSFLLRHGRIYSAGGHWTLAHRRWLAKQAFEHPAQQIVFQEAIDAIEDADQRLRRLEQQLAAIVPSWSMAPVVEAYQAMRGASFLVAVTFAAEIGDRAPLRNTASADGVSRPGPGGKLDRRDGAAQGSHPRRQSPRPPRAGRSGLDLPLSRQGQRDPEGPARRAAQSRARHRLEGAGPAVRPLSPAQRRRQEAAWWWWPRIAREMAAFLWAIGREVAPA